jgi:hypothetical protein
MWAIPEGQHNLDFVRRPEKISDIELVEVALNGFVEDLVTAELAGETKILNEKEERSDDERESAKGNRRLMLSRRKVPKKKRTESLTGWKVRMPKRRQMVREDCRKAVTRMRRPSDFAYIASIP